MGIYIHIYIFFFVIWIFYVQGGWELDESVEEAACRESLEEAGVLGIIEVSFPQFFLYFVFRNHV